MDAYNINAALDGRIAVTAELALFQPRSPTGIQNENYTSGDVQMVPFVGIVLNDRIGCLCSVGSSS